MEAIATGYMAGTVQIAVGIGTLVVASLTLIYMMTDWLRPRIPIIAGFLLDDKNTDSLTLSTGDKAKRISLRFENKSQCTLTGVVLDMRFHEPLVLSATDKAVQYIPGKTQHGRTADKSYYHVRLYDLDLFGDEKLDYGVELNTEGQQPGTRRISVSMYSTQGNYKYKRTELHVHMT